MTPLALRILLHYRLATTDYQLEVRRHEAASLQVEHTLRELVETSLLKSRYSDHAWACNPDRIDDPSVERPMFSITDRGKALVRYLCKVPLPVARWVSPAELDDEMPDDVADGASL